MHKITVVNKHHGLTGEYIGRGSPLGNPFIINKHGTREEVIEKYKQMMLSLNEQDHHLIIKELLRLHALTLIQDVNLVCFCAPKACHGDIIKQILCKEI